MLRAKLLSRKKRNTWRRFSAGNPSGTPEPYAIRDNCCSDADSFCVAENECGFLKKADSLPFGDYRVLAELIAFFGEVQTMMSATAFLAC